MPKYRVTVTEVLTHCGTFEVEAENEEEAEELASAEIGGDSFDDLDRYKADLYLDVEELED